MLEPGDQRGLKVKMVGEMMDELRMICDLLLMMMMNDRGRLRCMMRGLIEHLEC